MKKRFSIKENRIIIITIASMMILFISLHLIIFNLTYDVLEKRTMNIIEGVLFTFYAISLIVACFILKLFSKKAKESQERLMLMLDTSPLCAQIWAKDLSTIDCNQAALRLYRFKDKTEYIARFLTECSAEIQPCGRRADEKAVAFVNKAFDEGYYQFEWLHRIPDEDMLFPAEVTLVRAKYKDEDVVIGYTRDLREHYKMMEAIKYRDNLMMAVNRAAVLLLDYDVDFFKNALARSMIIIAETVKVDCVYIWHNHTEDGRLFCSQLYEWSKEKTIYNESSKQYAYDETFPGWEDALSKGHCINGPISEMPEAVQELLEPGGIVSILVVPIFIKDEFWGFVGFDDNKKKRVFIEEEVSILDSASLLIASSFIHNDLIHGMRETAEQLRAQDNLLHAVNQASSMLLTTKDNENMADMISTCMEFIGTSISADRLYIWKSDFTNGRLHHTSSHGWDSETAKEKTHVPIGTHISFAQDVGVTAWDEKLLSNEVVECVFSTGTKNEQTVLGMFNIKAVTVIPMFLDEELWGIFCIGDCEIERVHTEEELAILRSVSLMMASAINRHALVERRTRELATQTATFTTLFNSIPHLIFTKNTDAVFLHCNKAFSEHFGKTADEIKGISDAETKILGFSDEMIKIHEETDARVMSERRMITLEEYVPRFDGTAPLYETTKVPLVIGDEVIGLLGIARDITERKEMERKLAENYEVAKKARDEAEKANWSKSAFIANISHEIRTPMNVIMGLTELLMDEEDAPEDANDYLEKIHASGSILTSIINDILDISKMESGKFTLTPVNYQLAGMLSDVAAFNVIRIDEKPIMFNLEIDAGCPARLYGDDLRVRQILNNLLSNAFKYTKKGNVTLSISCERENEDEVKLMISVSDTGTGIRKEDAEKLFKDYHQVDAQANRNIEGTGLGLSITKRLTELMGGEISLESVYGLGSVFRVVIKQGYVSDEPISPQTIENLREFRYEDKKTKTESAPPRPNLSYARVLVVDDFPTNLDVAKGMLGKYKMKIDCVMSGQESINAIKAGEPVYDAIFMDHMMPGMDGIEAAERIRAIGTDYAQNIPVIALTANAAVGNEEMFLSKGFQAFLSKPINVTKLDAVIRQWIMAADSEQTDSNNTQLPAVSSRPSSDGIPGVNMKLGLSLYEDDMEMYVMILQSYAENVPTELGKLRNVSSESIRDYAINIHTIKGANSSIGAKELTERAKSMEMMAKNGEVAGILEVNEQFVKDTQTLIEHIKNWLAGQ